ncbi:hypothetical protein GCM10010441_07550 [Kitasatospora paracochleata]
MAVRGPLVWRAGDGPLADWLARVDGQLVGPQPRGYALWGDRTWPDRPYGRVLADGLTPAALAERLTAEGVDGLYARTTGGATLDTPRLEIALLAEPDRLAAPLLGAEPGGTPAGPVPLVARVRTPADLGAFLTRWAPLLPGGVPAFDWPDEPLDQPLGATVLHLHDSLRLLLQPLAAAEQRGVDAATRLLVDLPAADVEGHAAMLGSAAVLAEHRPRTLGDLGRWLVDLAELWADPAPLPALGLWQGASALPRDTVAAVTRIDSGQPRLTLRRHGHRELTAQGPVTTFAAWAAPLLTAEVHAAVCPGGRKKLLRWLERVERAVLDGPARWTVGDGVPLTTGQLADLLAADGNPDQPLTVAHLGPATLDLAAGRLTVTGRRDVPDRS